jgi:DNA-binding GntR family transcriptional regulator
MQSKPRKPRSKRVAKQPASSASEIAYARLREDIIDCVLAPGLRLTETEVAERVALGKTPVREALRRLVVEGLVTVHPRKGYTVAPITLRDVEELCGLRLIVEPAAMGLAAGRLSDAELKVLEPLCHVGYDVSSRASVRRYLQANRTFHTTIARACGNGRLAAMVDQLHAESNRVFKIQLLRHSDPVAHVRTHEDLLTTLRAGDAVATRRLSEEEIRMSQRFIIDGLLQDPALRTVAISVQ